MEVRSITMEARIYARLTMEGSEGGGGLYTRDRQYQNRVSHTHKGKDVDGGHIPSSVRDAAFTGSGLSKKGQLSALVEVAGTVDALKFVNTDNAILDATNVVAGVASTEARSGGSLVLDGSRDKVVAFHASKDGSRDKVVTDVAAAGSGVTEGGITSYPDSDIGTVLEDGITSGQRNANRSDTRLETESHRISSSIVVGVDAVNDDRRGSFKRYQPK